MRLRATIMVSLACVFVADLPVQGADTQPIPNFAANPTMAWVPSRLAGDDFLPPPSGPGPVVSDPAHPYSPNQGTAGQAAFHVADLTNPILMPWARAQIPEANAMENPAAIATQLTPPEAAASPPCANAGAAHDSNDNIRNRLLSLRIVFLLVTMKYRQWVVDVVPCRRPHAERCTTTNQNLSNLSLILSL